MAQIPIFECFRRRRRCPPLSCDLFDCCVFVCHRVLAPLSSLLIPKLSPLTDCYNGRVGRLPIVVFVLAAADRGGGMSSGALVNLRRSRHIIRLRRHLQR